MFVYNQGNTFRCLSDEIETSDQLYCFSILKQYDLSGFEKFIRARIEKEVPKELHSEGLIAGGFLLGLFLEYFKGVKANYSDIDHFHIEMPGDNESSALTRYWERIRKEFKNVDLYRFYVRDNNFELIDQQKEGNINIIKLTASMSFNWDKLIDSFDLNCVKIGYHIPTGSLHIGYDFIMFMNSLEMKITTFDRAFNSFARCLVKEEQYDILKFDYINHLNKTIIEGFGQFNIKEIRWNSSDVIESRTMDLIEEAKTTEHIGVETISVKNLEKLKGVNHPNLIIDDKGIRINYDFPKDYIRIYKRCGKYFKERNQPFMSKAQYRRLNDFFNKFKLEHDSLSVLGKRRDSYILYWFLEYGGLNQDMNLQRFFLIEKLINKHPRLNNNLKILSSKVNFDQFYSFCREIRESLALIGFLESINLSEHKIPFKNVRGLRAFKTRVEKEKYGDVFKPINRMEWYGKYIRELCSQEDLEAESKKMKHCVKGYWHKVRSGQERIFHIEYLDNHSTLSISPSGKFLQHKGVRNVSPENKHKHLARLFANYLMKYKLL